MGVAQCGAGPAMTLHFGGAVWTQRYVMRRPQVGVHPQFAVDERRDGLGRQVLGRAELARSSHWGVTLRGELSGEPGERAAEDMTPLGHHQLPSVCQRPVHPDTLGTTSNVARRTTRNTNEQPICGVVS